MKGKRKTWGKSLYLEIFLSGCGLFGEWELEAFPTLSWELKSPSLNNGHYMILLFVLERSSSSLEE